MGVLVVWCHKVLRIVECLLGVVEQAKIPDRLSAVRRKGKKTVHVGEGGG